MKGLQHYVENFASLRDNHLNSKLQGKRVVVVGERDDGLGKALEATGCTVLPDVAMDTVSIHTAPGWMPAGERADVAFLDLRSARPGANLHLLEALPGWLAGCLRPDGVMYAIISTAPGNPHFDVGNQLIRTRSGIFPTQRYLFDTLLSSTAIRMLDALPADDPGVQTRLYRIAPKRPTLLLILGKGHSGKTSFARDLLSLDPQMHLSNDYVYCELQRLVATGAGQAIPEAVAAWLGSGDGQACYDFNRRLDRDLDMLRAYAELLLPLIPRNHRVISMDMDLQRPEAITVFKTALTEAGYSVWVATR